jgi:hypothetical protein
LGIWNKMDNSTAQRRSRGGCPTKKREKSRVPSQRIDRTLQINPRGFDDLVLARSFETKAAAPSGRFNDQSPAEGSSLMDSIDPRTYSGLQAARDLDADRLGQVQIGSSGLFVRSRRSIRPAKEGQSAGSIWPFPRAEANLKPLSADSYLPYLDTI